jgi:uncharacterized membrane protein
MMGFAIGSACLVGLVAMRRRSARACGSGAGGPRGFGGRGHALRRIAWRLGLNREQARGLRDAVGLVRDAAFAQAGEVRRSRDDLADALRGESLDEARIDAAFARHDAALAGLRTAMRAAMAKAHATLDATQRERLAELVEGGAMGFGFGRCA